MKFAAALDDVLAPFCGNTPRSARTHANRGTCREPKCVAEHGYDDCFPKIAVIHRTLPEIAGRFSRSRELLSSENWRAQRTRRRFVRD